ncbi:MAG: hypothetical protein P8Z50_03170 [candidate division WOR-3 bacterium]
MFKKILIVLMVGCFLLGMATREEAENAVGGTTTTELEKMAVGDENQGTENYVKKVIIDADWGDGPGEFKVAFWSSPPEGPGPIAVDREGNIFIYDPGNLALKQFDKDGKFVRNLLKGKIILNMNVSNDTMYAIGLDDYNDHQQKLFLVNINNSELLISSSVQIPNTLRDFYSQVQLQLSKNKGVILRKGTEEYSLKILKNTVEFQKERSTLNSFVSRKANDLLEDASEFYLKQDDREDFYFGGFTIYKINSNGDVKFQLKLPRENYVGEYKVDKTFITNGGDIYYLYPTGKIVQEGWDLKFVPGK